MRFLALDFETNGKPNDCLRPCGAFPTQVSVDAFVPETNEVVHLYDSFIHGAEDLSDWVLANTPVTHDLLEVAPWAAEVSLALADLWREGDIIACHNATFDLGTVIPKIAGREHPFRTAPFICTMREPWTRKAAGKQPKLSELCAILGVPFHADKAHDATYDTHALAHCMKAAHERGETWSLRVPIPPRPRETQFSGQTREDRAKQWIRRDPPVYPPA